MPGMIFLGHSIFKLNRGVCMIRIMVVGDKLGKTRQWI